MQKFVRPRSVLLGMMLFLLVFGLQTTSAQAARCAQATIALKAGNAFIKAARAGSASQFAVALKTYADMRAIAVFGLGKHRKALAPGKLDEFTDAVTTMISRTFDDYRKKFRAQSIEFVDCRDSRVHTQMFFLGGKGYQPVIWRFNDSRIVDVNVQSLWLGQLLRTHIDDKMKIFGGNITKLIQDMRH
jgi:ABC-type transporter MlaC component